MGLVSEEIKCLKSVDTLNPFGLFSRLSNEILCIFVAKVAVKLPEVKLEEWKKNIIF